MYTLNLKVRDKILLPESYESPGFRFVGDNEDYVIHFDVDVPYTAMFAKFHTAKGDPAPILLDKDANVKVPLSVMKQGQFDVGIYKDGYATTPFSVWVDGSILNNEGIPVEEPGKSQVEQLIALANSIATVTKAEIDENGELLLTLQAGGEESTVHAGTARGNGILTLEQTTESGKDGGTNEVTVTFTNGETSTFRFLNGTRGNGIQKAEQTETSKESAGVNRFVFTMTDGETATLEVRNGEKGAAGNDGVTPEFSIGTVETVAPDAPAAASLSGTKEKPVLNLSIPKGEKGAVEGIEVSTNKTVTVGKDSAVTLDEAIQSQQVQLQWKIPGVKVVPPFTNYFLKKSNISYPRELGGGFNQFWSSSAAHGNADAFVSGHNYFWAFKYEMDGDSTVAVYNSSAVNTQTPDGSMTLTGTGWAYSLNSPFSEGSASNFALNNLSGTGRVIYTYCIDVTALQETYSDVPSTLPELAELFGELTLVPGQDFEGATTGGADNVFLNVTRGEESFTVSCLESSAILQGGDVLQTTDGSAVFSVVLKKVFAQEKKFAGKKWVAFGDSTTDPSINATKKYCDYIVEETGITLVNM